MSSVFHRLTGHTYPMAVRGEGVYLIDAEGRRYLDAAGGAAVSCLGHDDPEVIAAICEQLARLPYAHTMTFTNAPMEELAALLVTGGQGDKGTRGQEDGGALAGRWVSSDSPLPNPSPTRREGLSPHQEAAPPPSPLVGEGGRGEAGGEGETPLSATGPALAKAMFVSSGSEALEAAIKLARQYHVERGEPGRTRLIARRQSYAGNTLGALAAGGNPARRRLYGPLLMDVELIAPCYAYREQLPGEGAEAYGRRAADELEAAIERAGPGTVIAFIAETVAGATLGAVPPAPGYLRRIREICDRHGVLLILDEVMCGMGRTGTRFAFAQEGVTPDIVCVAKGLGAGYQPIGALLCSQAIYDAVANGSGALQHGHTYMGHPVACAAALAVQRAVERRGLLQRVRELGAGLEARLRAAFGAHPHVGDIRGRGLFWGLELVADRATKAPFDPALRSYARVKRAALEAGLLCYPMGGTIDGARGDHVILAPPYTISEDELDLVVERLAGALGALGA